MLATVRGRRQVHEAGPAIDPDLPGIARRSGDSHSDPLAWPESALQGLGSVISPGKGLIPRAATRDGERANRTPDPRQVISLAETTQLNRHPLPDSHGECPGTRPAQRAEHRRQAVQIKGHYPRDGGRHRCDGSCRASSGPSEERQDRERGERRARPVYPGIAASSRHRARVRLRDAFAGVPHHGSVAH
jgi:hypothetical protein